MKIAFVSAMGSWPWGGSEELWSQAALRLAEDKHQISISVCSWPAVASPIQSLIDRGASVHFRPSDRAPLVWQGLYRVFQMHRWWLLYENPDLVVISQGNMSSGLDWMEACKTASVPYDVIAHANSEYWWPGDQLSTRLADAYQQARRVYCVSKNNLQLLESELGMMLPNASVVQNPLKLPNRNCVPWPEKNDSWRLACVARLEPGAKGQDVLLRVMAEARWRNRPVHVDFIGEGPSALTLKQLAASLKLQNVTFCGYQPDIQEIWKQHHMLVLPSRYEGTPLALQEAMLCGRPALVTDVGGNAEWCQDGVTGFVASAPTVETFDACMERAWQQREKWQTMGAAAHEFMKKNSQIDPVGEFCRSLLESRP